MTEQTLSRKIYLFKTEGDEELIEEITKYLTSHIDTQRDSSHLSIDYEMHNLDLQK